MQKYKPELVSHFEVNPWKLKTHASRYDKEHIVE